MPEQGIWIGFFHGQFLVPQTWLVAGESNTVPVSAPVHLSGTLPTLWQTLEISAFFCVGVMDSVAVHVVQIEADDRFSREDPPVPPGYYSATLRAFVGCVSATIFASLSRAAQLLRWYREFQYCPTCGAPFAKWAFSGAQNQEMVRQCTKCGTGQYPRISPCVLVLVIDEQASATGRILLARGVRHPPGFWSTLAGFIEPGETAETAVAREVAEEVGVAVDNIVYRGSQSWPFPQSLMLGFWAKASTQALHLDAREIVAADWFCVQSIRENGLPPGVSLPPVGTLSRQLIDDYLAMNV